MRLFITKKIQKMKKIELEIPEGKEATWVGGVLTLVDEKPKNVMERIKTFEDACREMGIDADEWMSDREDLGFEPDIIAYMKLRIIVAALNEGWKPKFTNGEYRYYPYFYLYTKDEIDAMDEEQRKKLWLWGGNSYDGAACGLSVAHSNLAWTSLYASISARLALKSDELAVYCGKQFQSIWADYVYWGEERED